MAYLMRRFRLGRLFWLITISILLIIIFFHTTWKREIDFIPISSQFEKLFPAEPPTPSRNKGVHCAQPVLQEKDPVMMKHYKKMAPINCRERKQDYVYVDNGTLRFSKSLSPDTKCFMSPMIRGPGDYKFSYDRSLPVVKDKTPLVSEFFKVHCISNSMTVYDNIHAGVHFNTTLKDRVKAMKLPPNGLQLSVVMLGFDSMSRMSWLRRMPKSRAYFVNELDAIELEGYNIMGDGTPAALFPMLTGKHEQELPEARRGKKGAKSVDAFPWVWKDFQKSGYVTSWADSEINMAPFNYRLLGFEHAPTDFFMRPFYLAVDPKYYKKFKAGCHGSLRKQEVWFNFIKDIYKMYENDPKFLFQFYATLSHHDNNPLTMADDDLNDLLHFLKQSGYLDNTLLVLFGDHGSRFSKFRTTLSGKMEERLPYFALRFPNWFHEKYPDLIRNLRTNINRLTTPLDIHETLKDILRFDGSGMGNLAHRGISLFKEIPADRSCAQADIAPHWCACMPWKHLSPDDKNVSQAVEAAIHFINDLTGEYRELCALLTISNITNAYKSDISDSVLRFKETKGDRGLEPVLSDKTTTSNTILYQITFITAPSDGEFEVTIRQDLSTSKFILDQKAISRLNLYGSAPNCILDKNREIRQYCYCINQP